jgi:hypothetical protein
MDEFGRFESRCESLHHILCHTGPLPTSTRIRPERELDSVFQMFARTVLRSDEWYNDYILKAGIRDIIETRLFDSPSCSR